MKIQLFAAVGAMALIGGAAHASTVASGYAGVGYDYNRSTDKFSENGEGSDTGKYDDKMTGYFFDGAVALPITSLIGVQGDLSYGNFTETFRETYNNGESTGHDNFGAHGDGVTATAHLFARTDQWLVGAFVGETDTGFGTLKGGGVEGQYYFGRWTFAGSIGAAVNSYDDTFDNFRPYVVSGRVDARYFITDDFVVGANAGYMDGTYKYGDNNQETYQSPGLWTVGVNLEYKMPTQPFTVTLGYEHGDGNSAYSETSGFHDSEKLSGDTGTIGFRWTFGGSLLERDRHGASLNTMKDMFGGDFGGNREEFED